MVDRTVIIGVVVGIEAVAFAALIAAAIIVYMYLNPKDRSLPSDQITVQERGNSIYRDSAYSNHFSSFGLGSFGRGTLTFTRYQQQARLNNQQNRQQQQQQQPLEEINQEPLQEQELQQLTAETTA
ncbi:uncharacterized protein [Dysidea avara]|uniref:uncharacterized protein n=1 Tax=Dysidea avara TaxID=196820 RepID=UPI0033243E1B